MSQKKSKKFSKGDECLKDGKDYDVKDNSRRRRPGPDVNDASWYAKDKQLLNDCTNLSFNNAIGGYLIDETLPMYGESKVFNTIPGIMTMPYIPSYGVSTDFNSPLNVAKLKLYSFTRHMNSGHSNYDSPDLIQCVLSKTSIDSLWWALARVYACAYKFNQKNRYLPKALIEAQGVDAEDIVANLADFRQYLNMCAVKLNSIYIPNIFGYYQRQVFLNSYIFMDSPDDKCSLYIPIPYNAWKFNESGADIGNLTPEYFYGAGSKLKFADIKTLMDGLINPLVASEDINIMAGDMMKAYGEDKAVKLPYLPEVYDINFTYSEEVLEQIHNTTFVGEPEEDGYFKVIQDGGTGLLSFDPNFNSHGYAYTANDGYTYIWDSYTHLIDRKRFDLITNKATPERIIVASRNTIMFNEFGQSGAKIDSCGSEIFVRGDIWYNSASVGSVDTLVSKQLSRLAIYYLNFDQVFDVVNNEFMEPPVLAEKVSLFTKFDWAPICYFAYPMYNIDKGEWITTDALFDANDINNYTVLVKQNLAKLHELALLTELDVAK